VCVWERTRFLERECLPSFVHLDADPIRTRMAVAFFTFDDIAFLLSLPLSLFPLDAMFGVILRARFLSLGLSLCLLR